MIAKPHQSQGNDSDYLATYNSEMAPELNGFCDNRDEYYYVFNWRQTNLLDMT
jgi:hypothetical protein